MKDIKIIDAAPDDADLIAWGIMEAVGRDIVDGMAGEDGTPEDVRAIFSHLAARPDSQYSYRNSRIAVSPDGIKAGVCISYDGAELKELRRSFFEEAREVLGWNVTEEDLEKLPGETGADEFYLDTIAVQPEYRGHGIARLLIEDAARKAEAKGLPLGLLVADHNTDARKLYDKLGFKPVGRRWFAGEEMTNMRMNP